MDIRRVRERMQDKVAEKWGVEKNMIFVREKRHIWGNVTA